MKRPRTPLRPAFLLFVLTLTLAAQVAAQPPSRPAKGTPTKVDPNKPIPGKFTHPKLKGWINDVPDTGQFLPDSVWLLRVGPRVTTVGSYLQDWFSSYPEYRPQQDSAGRVKFLENLINRDVLGLTATALNRPLSFEDRLAVRETRQRSLAYAVYQRFVNDSVSVSEAEIRQVWETYKWVQHFRHILLPDRNLAEKVRRELVGGKIAWSAAVQKYSIATNDKGPNGDMGWGRRDAMEPQIAHRIYGLKPGETSQPVQDREGWHLVQSIERTPTEAPAYRAFEGAIRRQLFSEKASERAEKLLALLREQIGMRYDTANVKFASSRFSETMKIKQEPMSRTFEFDGSEPEFDDQDTSRVLARWNGGRYTLGDLVHAYHMIPTLMRPSLNFPEAMIGFVETTLLEPSIAEHGAKMGLEKDPLVVGPVRKKEEELRVEHMYQDSVASRVWVSKQERRAFYDTHLNEFFTFPSVEFAAITRTSKAGADSVERMLKSGVKASAILAADSAGGHISGSIQYRNQREEGMYHKVLFEELRPGGIQVRGPDRNGEYVVIQLLSYDGGRQLSFEEGETMIDESLQNQKSEEALKAMVARLKARYEIAWRPELVMLVKLVDPTLD